MNTLTHGKGYYINEGEKIPFEIEITIENGKFTGRIFNEESFCSIAEVTNGEITTTKEKIEITFKKIYPQEIESEPIYYKLLRTKKEEGKKTFVGGWTKDYFILFFNTYYTEVGKTEIIFDSFNC